MQKIIEDLFNENSTDRLTTREEAGAAMMAAAVEISLLTFYAIFQVLEIKM